MGYYEYQDVSHHQRHRGAFEESIELDRKYGKYEKIVVPEFEESKKATILHDFEKVTFVTLLSWCFVQIVLNLKEIQNECVYI